MSVDVIKINDLSIPAPSNDALLLNFVKINSVICEELSSCNRLQGDSILLPTDAPHSVKPSDADKPTQ